MASSTWWGPMRPSVWARPSLRPAGLSLSWGLQVGRSEGLRVGRTSDRLRNPANTGPEWAQPLLATRPAEATFALGPKGELGAILPIRLQASCLACHGESAKLAPGVVDALRKAYPKDQATGYHEGDLRGWFWVEVPAKSPSQNPTQH